MHLLISLVVAGLLVNPVYSNGVVLADSYHYLEIARSEWGLNVDYFSVGGINFLLTTCIAEMAVYLFDYNPFLIVSIINVLFVSASAIILGGGLNSEKAKIYFYTAYMLFPGLVIYIPSLNKEVILLFLLSVMFSLLANKKYLFVFLLLPILFATRNAVFVACLVVLLSRISKIPIWYFFVVSSVLLPLIDLALGVELFTSPLRWQRSEYLEQSSAFIMMELGQIQNVPGGAVLAFPFVLLINIISPLYQILKGLLTYHFFSFFNGLSAVFIWGMICAFFMQNTRDYRSDKYIRDAGVIFLSVLFFNTLLPISQFRYYMPVYGLGLFVLFRASELVVVHLRIRINGQIC